MGSLSDYTVLAKARRRMALIGIVGGVLVLALATAAFGATYRIRATEDDRWRPAHRFILKGDRIVWSNPDTRWHDIYKYQGHWSRGYLVPRLEPGERYAKRFRRVGNYYFRCARHSSLVEGRCRGMCGIIHVTRN